MEPHIPDFDVLARSIGSRRTDQAIKDALLSVWNARGRADVTALERAATTQSGQPPSGRFIKNLQQAIANLDAIN